MLLSYVVFNMDNVSVHVTKVNRPATCPKPNRTSSTHVKRLNRVKQVQSDKFQSVSLNTINFKESQSGVRAKQVQPDEFQSVPLNNINPKETQSTVRVYRGKRTSVHPENPNESLQSSSANQDIVSQATISLDSFNASIKVFYRLTKNIY